MDTIEIVAEFVKRREVRRKQVARQFWMALLPWSLLVAVLIALWLLGVP